MLQFTEIDGLSNNHLYAVYEDEQEQLWMSSDYGIIQFDKKTFQAKAYLPKDGTTHHEFNRISHHQSEDGRLYFGGLNGVTAFYPNEVNGLDE
ncbi:MAG: two-component regulator propeller domain-containing protein, partial [Pseudomonadota bacterium]